MNRMSLVAAVLIAFAPTAAFALITGGTGNAPLENPGWPQGADKIFNFKGRIAWWEGPPFGGGHWHAECRSDTKAFNSILGDFQKLQVKTKRIVIHDGDSNSFWLNPNHEAEKVDQSRIDWVFMVWQPENWKRLRQMSELIDLPDGDEVDPPAQIDVYTANINWKEVVVPDGIQVIDERLESHGFTADDRVVVEGRIIDLESKNPLAAKVLLQRTESRPKGGYDYTTEVTANADSDGHWVMKKLRSGSYRIVVESDGFVPLVVRHVRFEDRPKWQSMNSELARSKAVTGRVTDGAGLPLKDVVVRFDNVKDSLGHRYESTKKYETKTDAEGNFHAEELPAGKTKVHLQKVGYCTTGLGPSISIPSADSQLTMMKAARLRVTVDFEGAKRAKDYIVIMEPEGGNVIGSYGGTNSIDDTNQCVFPNVPPGRYILKGRPNPGSDQETTNPETIELKPGQFPNITLKAK